MSLDKGALLIMHNKIRERGRERERERERENPAGNETREIEFYSGNKISILYKICIFLFKIYNRNC